MPWCDRCDKYWTPTSMEADGSCPTCGGEVETGEAVPTKVAPKIPWHFWVLLVGVVGYLGWRLIQAVLWLL